MRQSLAANHMSETSIACFLLSLLRYTSHAIYHELRATSQQDFTYKTKLKMMYPHQHRLLSALLMLPCLLSSSNALSVPQSTRRRADSVAVFRMFEDSLEEDSPAEERRAPLTHVKGDLPSIIQQIADERQEFNMNLGKAMDTLRRDMPEILKSPPGTCCKLFGQWVGCEKPILIPFFSIVQTSRFITLKFK